MQSSAAEMLVVGPSSPPGSHAPPLLVLLATSIFVLVSCSVALLVGRLATEKPPEECRWWPRLVDNGGCGWTTADSADIRRWLPSDQQQLWKKAYKVAKICCTSLPLEHPRALKLRHRLLAVFYLLVSARGCPLTCSSSRAAALLVSNLSSPLVLMSRRSLHHW